YESYQLTVEYRWGEETFPPRKNKARTSGILLHATETAGGGREPAMQGIRVALREGASGNLYLTGEPGKVNVTLHAEEKAEEGKPRVDYLPAAPERTITTLPGWSGLIHRLDCKYPWKDEKGFRGRSEYENPAGEWNTLEVYCDGRGGILVVLNDTEVLACANGNLTRGRIALFSEGAEVMFRKIELKTV